MLLDFFVQTWHLVIKLSKDFHKQGKKVQMVGLVLSIKGNVLDLLNLFFDTAKPSIAPPGRLTTQHITNPLSYNNNWWITAIFSQASKSHPGHYPCPRLVASAIVGFHETRYSLLDLDALLSETVLFRLDDL